VRDVEENTKITGGYVYILMYYLSERICLFKFKYFVRKPDFGAWGVGGEESDRMFYEPQQTSTVLLMTATGVQKD
jgi:hypothetical protein